MRSMTAHQQGPGTDSVATALLSLINKHLIFEDMERSDREGWGQEFGESSDFNSTSGEGVGSLTRLWGRFAKVRNQEQTQMLHIQSRHLQETVTEITLLETTT